MQPERTTLAWLRTGIGLIGLSLLVLRLALPVGPAAWIVAFVTLVAAATVTTVQYRRHERRYAALVAGHYAGALGPIIWLTSLVLACCCMATVLVLFHG